MTAMPAELAGVEEADAFYIDEFEMRALLERVGASETRHSQPHFTPPPLKSGKKPVADKATLMGGKPEQPPNPTK